MSNHTATKLLVKQILLNPESREWTLQGLGMLRTYLDPNNIFRLHIWSHDHVMPDVTAMHTHPWDFTSTIIGGRVRNRKFHCYPKDVMREGTLFNRVLIQCGAGACMKGEPEIVKLIECNANTYDEGQSYRQLANEIHSSEPEDGTVTIIERVFGADTEHAYVFYPDGDEWVDAKPRNATSDEVAAICIKALDRWFS